MQIEINGIKIYFKKTNNGYAGFIEKTNICVTSHWSTKKQAIERVKLNFDKLVKPFINERSFKNVS